MKQFLGLLLVIALLSAVPPASSQTHGPETPEPLPVPADPPSGDTRVTATMLSVRESTQILAPALGARAAYSLDSHVAEAQIAEDQVRIWGRAPGHAVIVLVYSDFSTDSVEVTVTQAPPILPERVWSGLDSGGNFRGYYEVRASTDPTSNWTDASPFQQRHCPEPKPSGHVFHVVPVRLCSLYRRELEGDAT